LQGTFGDDHSLGGHWKLNAFPTNATKEKIMNKLLTATVMTIALGFGSHAAMAETYSDGQCAGDVAKADANGDGNIDATEGVAYVTLKEKIDTDKDGMFSKEEVAAACKDSDLREALKPKD